MKSTLKHSLKSTSCQNHCYFSDMLKHIFFAICIVSIFSCKSSPQASQADPIYYKVDTDDAADASIDSMIKPYTKQLEAEMNVVLATLEEQLVKSKPHNPLGNFMADAMYYRAMSIRRVKPVDFAVMNHGGIRVPSLEKGDITVGHIYELMPFDNQVVELVLNREQIQAVFDHMASKGGWPVSSGTSYSIKDGKATDIIIRKKPLEDREYVMVISDYLANGGDGMEFLEDIKNSPSPGMQLLRDVIIDHVKNIGMSGSIKADQTPRVIESK